MRDEIGFESKELLKAIDDVKNGMDSSFNTIYKITYKKVYFFALSIIKDEDIVHDVVQNVYVLVHKNINSLKDDKMFISWINRITYNESIRELQKANKRPISMSDEEISSKLIEEDNPLTKYLNNEKSKEIMNDILDLDEKYRTVIILKYFRNYKLKEIGEILGCAEGTVKSRLHNGKILLKNKLSKRYGRVLTTLLFGVLTTNVLVKTTYASTINLISKNEVLKSGSLKSYFVGGIAAGTIVTSSVIIINEVNELKEPIVIESVQYEKGFSKDDIEVELVFSGRKDLQVISQNNELISLQYLSNNKAVFTVNKNGTYKVVCSRDNNNFEILKEINITNIDKEAPVILNGELNNGKLDIFLEDNLSGIDYKSTIEGLNKYDNINNIEVDKSQNKISIYLEEGSYNIKVMDLVGNYTVYDINIEQE